MQKLFEKIRLFVLITIVFVLLGFCIIRLMRIQLVEGEELLAQSINRTTGTQAITAPRGEIVDINGDALVENRVGYNVILEYSLFPRDTTEQNEIILRVVEILSQDGSEWIENIPVTNSSPYAFEGKESDVKKLRSNLRLNTYATAENCIDELISKYSISSDYTESEQRIIAGVRYEMLVKEFSVGNRYVFAEDISFESVAKIKELSYGLSGVDVIEAPVRVYTSGDIFAHGIGTVGAISAEKYAELKEQGYKINDVIGREGIESFCEAYLRGQEGSRRITLSYDRQSVTTETITEAVPGKTVMLTIDSTFQKSVQELLAEQIRYMNEDLDDKDQAVDTTAGAVVVLDVNTGAVKAMASYPYYDINDYISDYSSVLNGENNPLLNRAINGLYRPGSTFKTITSVASLNEGVIDPNTKIRCNHDYPYLDIVVHCTSWHGSINVCDALQYSCNIFYYDVVQKLGLSNLLQYEHYFGLGVPLNFELGGATGYLASPETFDLFPNLTWTPGQTLQAAIGQSEIAITPLAMAVQAATLANGGTRYRPYIVDSIWDYNMTECLEKTEPIIESQIEENYDYVFETVRDGMVSAGLYGTGYRMADLPYPIAAKTGTPQVTTETTNTVIIAFYPAENPEIAISAIVEGGEKSTFLGKLVKEVVDAYYGYEYPTAESTDPDTLSDLSDE